MASCQIDFHRKTLIHASMLRIFSENLLGSEEFNIISFPAQDLIQNICQGFHGIVLFFHGVQLGAGLNEE